MADTRGQSYRDRVVGAYKAAWVLKVMAWTTAGLGLLSLLGTAMLYVGGAVSASAAFGTVLGAALGTILTGGMAYASATNLGIAGARLEIVLATAEVEGPEEGIDLQL